MIRRSLPLSPLFVLVFLSACAGQPDDTPPQRAETVVREIRGQIEQDAPEVAIGRISGLRQEDVLSSRELDSLESEAIDRITAQFREAVELGNADDAIRLYRNLGVLGQPQPADVSVNDLYLTRAIQYRDEGNAPAAISTLLRAPELSAMPVEVLEELVFASVELNNRYAARVAAEVLGRAWLSDHPDVASFLDREQSALEAVESTVTVWVNRGIRLENGVGFPDRVIGSGFFIDPRGYIITNHHVIASEVDPEYEGYSRLYVRLPEDPDERIPAQVVGYDRIFDIALLKVELDAPHVLSFTDIRSLEPGRKIVAIGSPGGLENTITSGIISATGRRFLQLGDAMQVDVPINPGNSGGPLLDEEGNVIGVVFAGIEQFEGINFAIPSFWIQYFLPELFSDGEVVHPWLGVSVQPNSEGLEVVYVAPGAPAQAAGLQVGDVLTQLGDWKVEKIGSAQRVVLGLDPGSLLRLRWKRSGVELDGVIALASRPFSPVEDALKDDLPERLYPVLFGMQVSRLGETTLSRRYQVERVYRGSVADETGITPGDTFAERDFEIDEEFGLALLRIVVKKRTEGFMQTGIQLPAYVETDTFL